MAYKKIVVKDLLGQQFGGWTAIKFVGTKNENALWLCECSGCKTQHVFNSSKLSVYKRQNIKGCMACRSERVKLTLIGKKFNKWTVLSFDNKQSNNHEKYWICKCECGNIASVTRNGLVSGGSKQCNECSYQSDIPCNFIINKIIVGAKKRSKNGRIIEVSITGYDLLKQLEKQNFKCALTGQPLIIDTNRGQKENIRIQYNASVDRIDSNKGYTVDNIQWVTVQTNLAKQDYSQEEFIEMCHKVAKTHPR